MADIPAQMKSIREQFEQSPGEVVDVANFVVALDVLSREGS